MSTDQITGEVVHTDIDAGEPVTVAPLKRRNISWSNGASPRFTSTTFVLLPVVFLLVTLLGGLRLGEDNAFVFLKPPLICLVLGAITVVIFIRAGLIRLGDWISHDFSFTKNAAGSSIMFTMFAATVQVFNSLLPEQGLTLWVIGFCFCWTLVNYLYSNFDAKRIIESMGVLFGLAFVVKYIALANMTAPSGGSWLGRIIENPAQETFTWILDLPRFAPGTGYIQFFTISFYLLALYLTPASTRR